MLPPVSGPEFSRQSQPRASGCSPRLFKEENVIMEITRASQRRVMLYQSRTARMLINLIASCWELFKLLLKLAGSGCKRQAKQLVAAPPPWPQVLGVWPTKGTGWDPSLPPHASPLDPRQIGLVGSWCCGCVPVRASMYTCAQHREPIRGGGYSSCSPPPIPHPQSDSETVESTPFTLPP